MKLSLYYWTLQSEIIDLMDVEDIKRLRYELSNEVARRKASDEYSFYTCQLCMTEDYNRFMTYVQKGNKHYPLCRDCIEVYKENERNGC